MADSKISDLTAITTLAGTEEFVVADSGASKKITAANVQAAIGGGGDPVFDRFGAPATAYEFDTSSFTGLTAMGTPDAADADTTYPGCYYVADNAGSTAWCGRYASSPSTPWTAIALLLDYNGRNDYNNAALFVGEATPGKFETVGLANGNRYVQWAQWTNPTTFGGSYGQFNDKVNAPIWLALRANSGTSLDYLVSYNGRSWFTINTARNPGFTFGSIGVGLKADNTAGISAVFEYLRIWTSALTFPTG